MKKSLLFGLACTLGLVSTINAQTYITNPQVVNAAPSVNLATPFVKTLITGNETNTGLEKSIKGPAMNPYTNQPPVQFGVETVIGITTYDLQSNSSVQNRVMNNGDGTISAVWTYSESFDIAAADRGTGYNYYDGANWGPAPTARIEAEKTGWPNIGRTTGGRELFLCHNIAQTFISQGARNTIGSGPWTMSNVTATNQVWNRMAVGGANGQSVHQVSLYDPFGGPFPGTGVQSQLLYWRSLDGGATYDIQEAVIPGIDASNFSGGFSGDSYHIAARGDTVVLVVFGAIDPTIMAKSTDNGDTWALTTLMNVMPAGVTYDPASNNTTGSTIGISDITGDGVADTVSAGDGAGWVLIDHSGMAHVFVGAMDYIDDTPGDDTWSYFPGTNGMMYWNENFGSRPAVSIGGALDLDSSGVLDIVGIADYFQSMSAFPSAGIDAAGCMYVSYSALMENMDQGSQNYRHVYIVKSCDNGCSWSAPIDVTPGTGFEENVYCAMALEVDASIHIVWQRDFEPGIAVNGDMDAYVTNDIVHSVIPVTDINTSEVVCIGWIEGDTIFCAGDSLLLSATCGTAWLWSNGETTQNIYYKGAFGPVSVDITTPCGVLTEAVNMSAPTSAPTISVTATANEICNGDQTTLTVTSSLSGVIGWSTLDSTASITVDTVGTYFVSVSNCGGVAVDSIQISLPSQPVATIAGNDPFCSGDTLTLTAGTEPSASYLWSTGDTTQSIFVTTIGTFQVLITNCAGPDSTSVTTVFHAAPTVVTTVLGNQTFCEDIGTESVTLTAFGGPPSSGPFTYTWSNGETGQSITLDSVAHTGPYTVSAMDICGVTVSSPGDTITVYDSPMADTLSVTDVSVFGAQDGAITATASGGTGALAYSWDTSPVTTTLNLSNVFSGTYVLTVTDDNGCTTMLNVFVGTPFVGINEVNIGSFSIHPNPNNGRFVVNLRGLYNEEYSFVIRNIIGQTIYAETFNGLAVTSVDLNLSEGNKGVYFLTISNSKGKRTEKLIIH